jgi:hypothetical protein
MDERDASRRDLFVNRRVQIVTQTTRHAVTAIYPPRVAHDAVENAMGSFVCGALGPADR